MLARNRILFAEIYRWAIIFFFFLFATTICEAPASHRIRVYAYSRTFCDLSISIIVFSWENSRPQRLDVRPKNRTRVAPSHRAARRVRRGYVGRRRPIFPRYIGRVLVAGDRHSPDDCPVCPAGILRRLSRIRAHTSSAVHAHFEICEYIAICFVAVYETENCFFSVAGEQRQSDFPNDPGNNCAR